MQPSKGPLLEGSLIHYNLDYNVALVSVKNYNACPLAICKRNLIYESSKVVSVLCRVLLWNGQINGFRWETGCLVGLA